MTFRTRETQLRIQLGQLQGVQNGVETWRVERVATLASAELTSRGSLHKFRNYRNLHILS